MRLHDMDERELDKLGQKYAKTAGKVSREQNEYGEYREGREAPRSKISISRRNMGRVILVVLGCVALVLLIIYIAVAISMRDEGEEAMSDEVKLTYTKAEVDALLAEATETAKAEEARRILSGIQQNLTDGLAVAKALRPFYTNDVVVATGGRIRFFPIQEGIKKNRYSAENLVELERGELQYTQDGQVISHKGIDVSYHQGEIDWQQVAQDGVEFAFLRVGIRGYGTGKVVLDEQFENNVKGALANGIKVGVYFYSQSVNQEEVLEEARVVLEQIAPYRVTGPVVYDAEKVDNSRTSNLSAAERTDMAITFCETVKEAGYRPMVYLNLDTAFTMVELERLEAYDKWFAHYGTDMYYPYDYKIWQYSESGRVAGINGDVDLNISFEMWE